MRRRPLALGPSSVTPERVGSPPQVSQAAPVTPGPDDEDDDDELLGEDDDVLDEDELDAGAVTGCFLSLLQAATSAATHSNTSALFMTIVRRTGTGGLREITA
jgi:hypothetical protein